MKDYTVVPTYILNQFLINSACSQSAIYFWISSSLLSEKKSTTLFETLFMCEMIKPSFIPPADIRHLFAIQFIFSLTATYLFQTLGCGKQDVNKDLESIDASEIKQIELTGTTGGKDGNYSYFFSDKEVVEFIDLLNQVKLGDIVDENKALSSGAVSYYTIYFATDETLTISPGKYFEVEDTYYEFDNYDELWDEFIVFNSIK